jgi:hypothetical protein
MVGEEKDQEENGFTPKEWLIAKEKRLVIAVLSM